MLKLLASAALACALLAGAPGVSPANAQDLELRIGPQGVTPRFHDRQRDEPGYRRRYREDARGGCDFRDAEDAARAYGLHRPHVIRASRHSVVVEGLTRDGPRHMRFVNVAGCPSDG